ncbi:GNAT family N-acetyltransferase [Tyzzerella sp. OttesenSCG-928-J15]|nr:GNAT family N-acetyltransferase [Tyzzerella sp. OttesenSCG-928-J15]
MTIEKFNSGHIEEAAKIAVDNYKNQRSYAAALPDEDYYSIICDKISITAEKGIGIAALQGGKLAGYMVFMEPWDNHFGLVRGTFSPIHAHGALNGAGEKLYSKMYQNIAEIMVKGGIYSHALDMYASDKKSLASFVLNGFGIRCFAAVRPMEKLEADYGDYEYKELKRGEFGSILPLVNLLANHLRKSPSFMNFKEFSEDGFEKAYSKRECRIFGAYDKGRLIAYLETCGEGENFTCFHPHTQNICGAYLYPEYRGKGIYEGLMNFAIEIFSGEGYKRLAVDGETLNPTAKNFWGKYFDIYTYGIIRRIDERIKL